MQNKKIILSFIALIFIASSAYFIKESSKEYIDGNILHLPITNTHEGLLPSPFAGDGLLTHLFFRTLFLPDSSFKKFNPDLAQSYEILDDGYTYKVVLKPAQKWSDGTEITPADIVFTIETLFVAKTIPKSALLTNAFSLIENTDINGNTITFTLKEQHYNFLAALAQLPVLPKHILADTNLAELHLSTFWANPVVSSMYVIDEHIVDSHFILKHNTYYNGTKPKIDEVHLHFAYKTAPLDYYYTNSISDMTEYNAMRNFTAFHIDMNFIRYFVFSIQGSDGYINPKMQDKRVREAICLAIYNVGLKNSIYVKTGNQFTTNTKEIEDFYVYNPAKAKELLKEANYDFKEPLRLMYYYKDTTSQDVMRYIAKNLESVGFTVELMQPDPNISGGLYTNRIYDVLYKGLASYDNMEWYQEYDKSHPFLPNIIDTKGEFEVLLDELLRTTDSAEHQRILQKLDVLDKEKLYKFPIYSPLQVVYMNTDRVLLPKDIVFGNPWYISDLNFANWQIKKK